MRALRNHSSNERNCARCFYGAIFLFLIYYVRVLGRHSWPGTMTIAVITPIVTFFFFDIAMRIVLPKGYLEPLFIPLYDIFL